MARLMLDSTVLIDALRGRPAAQRLRTLRRTGVEPWGYGSASGQDDPTPNPRSSRPVVVKQRTFRGQRGGAEDLITGAGRRSAAGRESDGAAIWAETSNRTKPDRPRPGARRAEHAGSVYAH